MRAAVRLARVSFRIDFPPELLCKRAVLAHPATAGDRSECLRVMKAGAHVWPTTPPPDCSDRPGQNRVPAEPRGNRPQVQKKSSAGARSLPSSRRLPRKWEENDDDRPRPDRSHGGDACAGKGGGPPMAGGARSAATAATLVITFSALAQPAPGGESEGVSAPRPGELSAAAPRPGSARPGAPGAGDPAPPPDSSG